MNRMGRIFALTLTLSQRERGLKGMDRIGKGGLR